MRDMMDNHAKMAEAARQRFLNYDQNALIQKWDLRADEEYLYFSFFHEPYRLRRTDGVLLGQEDAPWRLASPHLSEIDWKWDGTVVYDFLCHSEVRPTLKGEWLSISSLGGIIGAGHETGLDHAKEAAALGQDMEKLHAACQSLGGIRQKQGDVSYILPVTEQFPVWFQLWEADEEFPASLRYLWDANALQFMHYETLWYAMSCLQRRLEALVGQ